MDIEFILLALIKTHKEVSGYELNRIIRDSNRFFLVVSLAYLYPNLKKLYDRGLVTYTNTPIANRPDKKTYQITPAGELVLNDWLKAPIDADMYFKAFLLKMEFAALMDQATIVDHIDREIQRLQIKIDDVRQLANCYHSGKLEPKESEVLKELSTLLEQTDLLRLKWLQEWKAKLAGN